MKNTAHNIDSLIRDINNNQSPIEALIGLYLNRHGYSDVNPIGRVVRVIGKKSVEVALVRPTTDWPINKEDLKFVSGGFSGVCLNGYAQTWEYAETGETIRIRISKAIERDTIPATEPFKYYDYNF